MNKDVKAPPLDDYENKVSVRLYLFSLVCFSLARVLDALSVSVVYPEVVRPLSNLIQVFALVLLLYPLADMLHHGRRRRIVVSLLAILLFGLTGAVSHSLYLAWFSVYLIACPTKDCKILAKAMFFISAFALFSGLVCSLLGVDSSLSFVRGANEVRHSLGFVHPNSFGLYVLVCIFSFLILRFGSIGLYDLPLVLLAVAVVIAVSGSRTTAFGLLVCYIILIVAQACNKKKVGTQKISVFLGALFVMLAASSIVLVIFYNPENSFMSFINGIFSGRLSYPHGLIMKSGIRLFGFDLTGAEQYVPLWAAPDGTIPIDNAYAKILIAWGPFVFFAVCVSWFGALIALSGSEQAESYLLLGVLAVSSVIGLAENYAIDIVFLYPALVLVRYVCAGLRKCGPHGWRTVWHRAPSNRGCI